MKIILKSMTLNAFGLLVFLISPISGINGLITPASANEPIFSTQSYDPSVFMPVPRLCPDGFEYVTDCEYYGAGCNIGVCPEEKEQ